VIGSQVPTTFTETGAARRIIKRQKSLRKLDHLYAEVPKRQGEHRDSPPLRTKQEKRSRVQWQSLHTAGVVLDPDFLVQSWDI